MLVFGWFCAIKTFPNTQKLPGAPAIEVSKTIFDQITNFLTLGLSQEGESQQLNPLYARKIFAEMIKTDSFVYSFEIGSKNIELTRSLHPRPVRPQFDIEYASEWLEDMYQRQFQQDAQELLERLNCLKSELTDSKQVTEEKLYQVRKFATLVGQIGSQDQGPQQQDQVKNYRELQEKSDIKHQFIIDSLDRMIFEVASKLSNLQKTDQKQEGCQ